MRKILAAAFILAMFGGAAVAQQQPNTAASAGSNNQLSNERSDPNASKPYQPQNPAPDTRSAPTSSSSGIGPDSGGRPEADKSAK